MIMANETITGELSTHCKNVTPLCQKVTNFWRDKLGSVNLFCEILLHFTSNFLKFFNLFKPRHFCGTGKYPTSTLLDRTSTVLGFKGLIDQHQQAKSQNTYSIYLFMSKSGGISSTIWWMLTIFTKWFK